MTALALLGTAPASPIFISIARAVIFLTTSMNLSDFIIGIGKPLAYYPSMARAIGLKPSIFIVNLCWWTGSQSDPDGWIYKTREDFWAETGLGFEEQRTAIKTLKARNLLEVREDRLSHKTYYRILKDNLDGIFGIISTAPKDSTPSIPELPLALSPGVWKVDAPESGKSTPGRRESPRRGVDKVDAGASGKSIPSIYPGTPSGTPTGTTTTRGGVGEPVVSEGDQAAKIYAAYPLKVGKPDALRAILKCLHKFPFDILLNKTEEFANVRNGEMAFCPHPSTWFNQERFNDDPSTWITSNLRPATSNGIDQGPSTITLKPLTENKMFKEILAREQAAANAARPAV